MIHFSLVQRAYNELIAEGKIFPSTNQEEVEKQKALTTFRAAYYINTERDPSFGLLSKTSGNNYKGLSVDVILNTLGEFYDIMTDVADNNGRLAQPVDGGLQIDGGLVPRWIKPTKEIAELPNEIPNPNPIPPPSDDIKEQLDRIEHLLITLLNKPTEPITFPTYEGSLFGIKFTMRPK